MAITLPTFDTVLAYVRSVYANRFPGRDLGTESYLGKQARSEAMVIFQLMNTIGLSDADSVPNPKMSSAAIDLWAQAVGLPSNAPGVYGRKSATTALGATGTVTGTNGQTIADGSTLTASDGNTTFRLNNGGAALQIPGSPPGTGSISATFDAVTTGTIGNIPVGSILTWTNAPGGIDTTVAITAVPTTLAIDTESDAACFQRLQAKMQAPSKGGTSPDYRFWAESVSGVSRFYPYPLRGGMGSMHGVIVGSGSGTPNTTGNRPRLPTATVQNLVYTYINGSGGANATGGTRPVTVQGFKPLLPYFAPYGASILTAGGGGLTIVAKLVPSKAKYNFDWNDSAGYSVNAYTAGSNGAADTLQLNTIADQTLKNAVDNKNYPRIQIFVTATGGPAVPLQCQVTAYADGAGKTTLTLQNPLPSGWVAPNNGDSVNAGGPMVSIIGNAILSYVDALGPSRAGAYAESVTDYWEDTCAVDRVAQICLSAIDFDGTRFAKDIFNGALTNLTIQDGSNAAASVNVQAKDGGTDTTIECVWARFIKVLRGADFS